MKILIGIIIAVAAVVFGLSSNAHAQNSQLHQSILPLDCTLTEVNNGVGVIADSNCPPQAPIVDNIQSNDGRPIISGKYDAANSLSFRVRFNSIWYVLGVDPELTAVGNVWRLNLSNLAVALEPGEYEIYMEMVSLEGNTLAGDGDLTIRPDDPIPDPGAGPTNPVTPIAPNTGYFAQFLRSFTVPSTVVAFIVSVVIAVLALFIVHRKANTRR